MRGDTLTIMFVCSGNICRSPLAHRVLERQAAERGIAVSVESSGTGSWHVGEEVDSRMRATAARRGLTVSHRARRLSRSDVERYDLLFAMGSNHYRDIASLGRRGGSADLAQRLYLFRQFDPDAARRSGSALLPIPPEAALDVPDPYYGGTDGFEEVYEIVDRTCGTILDAIADGSLP
ncbi:MAG: low molecular weight phosphotyrosine protein phosphatase [Spirochaetales bacterium]|nr:low molecular weight phosphotyrosine protein phosphatase [Spirochaetales bacterium]